MTTTPAPAGIKPPVVTTTPAPAAIKPPVTPPVVIAGRATAAANGYAEACHAVDCRQAGDHTSRLAAGITAAASIAFGATSGEIGASLPTGRRAATGTCIPARGTGLQARRRNITAGTGRAGGTSLRR